MSMCVHFIISVAFAIAFPWYLGLAQVFVSPSSFFLLAPVVVLYLKWPQ